ncbi:MAG TPA: hypothetical protein VJ570_02325 [Holophagaceae bacterium]|nr:hypothetical protein [Holophagaceae bacterium]
MKHACLLALALLPLRADALSDLKAALQRLKGRGPLTAQAEVHTWSRDGKKGAEPQQGSATVRLEDGPQGLKLGWTPEQLERAAQARGKKGKDGEGAAMKALGMEEALRLMRAADDLLGELAEATLVSEGVEAWEGRPARKVVLNLSTGIDKEDMGPLKEARSQGTFWIAPDGVPYAMSTQLDLKGRVLLISFEVHQSAQRRYLVHQGRLLLVQEDRLESGAGAGQKGEGRTLLKLTPGA